MRLWMKKALVIFGVVTLCIIICSIPTNVPQPVNEHLVKARKYAEMYGMNTDTIILCDFSIHSGRNRFFVYGGDEVLLSCLCAHGQGRGSTESEPEFSNEQGSN